MPTGTQSELIINCFYYVFSTKKRRKRQKGRSVNSLTPAARQFELDVFNPFFRVDNFEKRMPKRSPTMTTSPLAIMVPLARISSGSPANRSSSITEPSFRAQQVANFHFGRADNHSQFNLNIFQHAQVLKTGALASRAGSAAGGVSAAVSTLQPHPVFAFRQFQTYQLSVLIRISFPLVSSDLSPTGRQPRPFRPNRRAAFQTNFHRFVELDRYHIARLHKNKLGHGNTWLGKACFKPKRYIEHRTLQTARASPNLLLKSPSACVSAVARQSGAMFVADRQCQNYRIEIGQLHDKEHTITRSDPSTKAANCGLTSRPISVSVTGIRSRQEVAAPKPDRR